MLPIQKPLLFFFFFFATAFLKGDLQDGRGVRPGDRLPPHKYVRNTSTCGTTLQNTYWTLEKTSDHPKGKKLPTYLGRAKEKRKKRDKTIGMGPAPLGGSCEEGKLSTHQEAPSLKETGSGWGGSFGATEESAATGVRRAKRRDSRTEDQCWPALTSLRGLSASLLGRAGAGSWG